MSFFVRTAERPTRLASALWGMRKITGGCLPVLWGRRPTRVRFCGRCGAELVPEEGEAARPGARGERFGPTDTRTGYQAPWPLIFTNH
jgi:hypothetical protein